MKAEAVAQDRAGPCGAEELELDDPPTTNHGGEFAGKGDARER